MIRKTTLTAAVAAIALPAAVGTGMASAHAEVEKRYPTPGATVSSVKTVRITFDEAVITGKISSVSGASKVSSSINAKKTVLTAKVSGLSKGTHTVKWRVKADDGDTQTGHWSFKVG